MTRRSKGKGALGDLASFLRGSDSEESKEIAGVRGLYELLSAAWKEAGRQSPCPRSWRPFEPTPKSAEIRDESGNLTGFATVRAAPGMDCADFVYATPGPDRQKRFDTLLGWCETTLAETGLSSIVYTAFAYWREGRFPDALRAAFEARGYTCFNAVFLSHALIDLPGEAPPLSAPYTIERFEDRRTEEAARMMLRCPEPEAIYWDYGLCCRSIAGAAAGEAPRFPDGLGQQVTDAEGKLCAFTLTTLTGYVNHVYTLPEHRGKGLAKAMVGRVLQAVKRRGLQRATILTHDTNPGAIRLYEKLGFQHLFTYPQFYVKR